MLLSPSTEKYSSCNGLILFQPGAHFTTLPQTSCQQRADVLPGGAGENSYYFRSHSARCILTSRIRPGGMNEHLAPWVAKARGHRNRLRLHHRALDFLRPQDPSYTHRLTVFSPPEHHFHCCCLGVTWKGSPPSLTGIPRSAARLL